MKKLGVFLIVFGGAALFNRAELSSVDEGFIFNTTAALVEKQSWTMDERLSDRSLSRFSPLPSLFAAPFYFVADKFVEGPSAVGMPKKRDWLLFACGLSSCFLTAWTAVAFVGLIRQLGYSESSAVWTSLLWAFGTLAFPYSSSLFHQVVATLLLVYVVRFAFGERILATAFASALLVSVQLTLAAAVLPFAFRDGWRPNWRSLIGLVVGMCGGFAIHVLFNWMRGDHWLHGAYETETFITPTFMGSVGLFLSSGKGLLFFAPLAFAGMLLLIPLASRCPDIGRPLLFAVACHCIVVIHWWAWHGFMSWGPRLLVPIMPLALIPVADAIDRWSEIPIWLRRGLATVAAVSIGVNVWAATQPMIGFVDAIPDGTLSEWMFVPSLGPLGMRSMPMHVFEARFPWSTGTVTAFVVSLAIFASGAAMLLRFKAFQVKWTDVAPWRALALAAVVVALPVLFRGRPHPNPQRGNLESRDGVSSGYLHLPIRGTYHLEILDPDSGSITVGSSVLSKRNPRTALSAPPMSAPVAFNQTQSHLLWTSPGNGYYRVPVPPDFLIPWERAQQEGPVRAFVGFSWLLLLAAVPLYFDWLLGGRKMKPVPGEP